MNIKKIAIRVSLFLAVIGLLIAAAIFWLFSFIPESGMKQLEESQAHEIPYLMSATGDTNGRILAVVTSVDKMGESGKKTGYELTELARAYWVFNVNGFEVDIASTQGGDAPKILDLDDMGRYDYAFLNHPEVQLQLANTLLIDELNPADYDAVYFVGGKGAMFDFVDNAAIKSFIAQMDSEGGIISAVCHGPAALLNVVTAEGENLLRGTQVTAFSNSEEIFLIPDAEQIFGFLLEDGMTAQGASFSAADNYLNRVVVDGNVITGQNPWSVWTLAEEVVRSLGVDPVERPVTAEERSVDLLAILQEQGYSAAKASIEENEYEYQSLLILMHAIIAAMELDLVSTVKLMLLAEASKTA
ncbi:type 1 glutamine amidotransferase domain-containing protein [Umboniibacter marinipuniceus]|uniref:Putative intracellular protease/amidase n=1 Tax=Umboniibacter marinipuniceus TaxID=569599 RepID=A0A3M0AGG2_9GAMM|nr:type 1 glutamine amidotransferase domain-containing protein [Umboniibacter marinipuniceus]RMA82649.1 putative intracellular protease/amidase [Umboniibacter marinipuniceus]